MNAQELIDTARALVAGDKGLLAMDESNPTCNKRFAKLGIPQTEEARRAYRELIVTTPGLGESISGAILYDETIRQQKRMALPLLRPSPMRESSPASKSIPAQGHGGSSRREDHRRSGRIARRLAEYSQWARVLPMARGDCRGQMAFPAGFASTPTRTRWLAMPRCARKPDWSPSWSRRCLWKASIPWSSCYGHPERRAGARSSAS